MKKHIGQSGLSALILAALLAGMIPAAAAEAGGGVPVSGLSQVSENKVTVLVELEDAPAAERTTYGERGEEDYKAALMEVQEEVVESAQSELELEVGYQYNTIFNGFSCEISSEDLDALAQMEGVKAVYPVHYYAAPETVDVASAVTPQMALSGEVTGNTEMTADGYGGQGIVVAVLDSGINVSHPAFGVYGDVLGNVALTQEAVEDKIADNTNGTGGRGKYVNAKIPFMYNYNTESNDITYGNAHGTHVAGIVGGYEAGEEKAEFSGAAPGAQILGMQIFSDEGGTSTDIYVKALEDAYNLGADVVNMSLGADYGFSTTGVEGSPEEEIYARMAQAGILVCVSAGNGGSYLTNWDSGYADYATVDSPSTYGDNISVASVDNSGIGASKDGTYRFSSDFSGRGPANNLDIRPTLTSVGGGVTSANAEYIDGTDENAKYVAQWGTSMSAPNLAGTFASLLQYLRGEKGLTKAAAGQTALALMESAATPVPGENNLLATVIQQGAGLGNSALAKAAYESGAYLENPIQELRDDPDKIGSYVMTLTLKNATNADVTYTPGAVVMTDEVKNGVNTQLSAYLYSSEGETSLEMATVTFSGSAVSDNSVTVPAGGSVDMTATVALTEAGKAYMNDAFPNGGYIDGYITFAPVGESDAPEVHATFLAFYGDWAAVPVFAPFYPLVDAEIPTLDEESASPAVFPTSEALMGFCDFTQTGRPWRDDYLTLGENPMNGWNATEGEAGDTAPYKAVHAAIPGGYKTDTSSDNILYNTLAMYPVALRNMETLTISVTTLDGAEIYRSYDYDRVVKETYDSADSDGDGYTGWYATVEFVWDGYSDYSNENLVSETRWLASGTEVLVTLEAEMPYDRDEDGVNETQTTQFALTVDWEDPTLDASGAVYDGDAGTLTVSASDDQYVAAVYLVNEDGETVDCDLFSEDTANTAVTATLDVSGYTAGDTVKVRVMDYATNWIEEEITLPVPGQATVTFDPSGGTLPDSAEDYTQTLDPGVTPAFPAANPTRTDYTFLGWAASADGEVLEALPATVADTDVTYYARWEAVTPTVTVALRYDEAAGTITATPTVNLTEYEIAYTWTENGEAASGADTGSVYTVPQDAQAGDHEYTCTATVTHPGDPTKTAASQPVTWTVTIAGSETGGNETGGGETGDNETGGSETGDNETGGSETGDNETGDNETGDSETGGNETGDSETGDSETGGNETGTGTGTGTGTSTNTGSGTSVKTASSASNTTEKWKNADGTVVTVVTTSAGDKTFSITDAAGDVVAQVTIPAEIAPLPESQRFTDVPVDHWADGAIHRMASLGLFKGVDEQNRIFDMTSPMTRGALTEVLYRLSNGKADSVAYSFFDVETDAWYAQAVIWATKWGVVNGTGSGTFQPQRAITRQELATMMYRYAQLLGAADDPLESSLDAFQDGDDTDAWAASGVAWCVQEGILLGKGDGALDPTAEVTRAEAATMLDRLLQVLK